MPTRTPPLHDMMARLVAVPSASSVDPELDQSNRGVVDLLAEWLEGLGFAIQIVPVAARPEKANLIATLGEGAGGLVMAGHGDTVPVGERRWQRDPHRLHEENGCLYGLGMADMKGFLALAVEAAKGFAGGRLAQPLVLLATADEESSMKGVLRLRELGQPRARYALIGEPTGLVPVRLHKGVAMEALCLEGEEGHSSNPALGVNAIDGMHTALGVLKSWRTELAGRHRNQAFEVPAATLNLGRIQGGDAPNRICGRCELHFDLRLLPGMEFAPLRAELVGRLRAALKGSGLKLRLRHLDVAVPPFDQPAESEWVRRVERISGQQARSAPFCSEAPYLQGLGMQTVLLGPGDLAQAHQPDEYLRGDRIGPTLELLGRLIQEVCGE